MTLFGPVQVEQVSYQMPGVQSLQPLEAMLNVPKESYSFGVSRRIAQEAAKNSFAEVVAAMGETTGAGGAAAAPGTDSGTGGAQCRRQGCGDEKKGPFGSHAEAGGAGAAQANQATEQGREEKPQEDGPGPKTNGYGLRW